ncbi:MAG: N-acetylmuramoyl-L-alanine amidase, partial [Bacteroidota bacterium]
LDENLSVDPSEGIAQASVVSQPPKHAAPKTRGNYMIFGSKYASVPLISNTLRGKVYYLVSGHGGVDPGAVGKYGKTDLCEDEYAYDVALRLGRNLLMHGATVYMITRDNNDGIREGKILPCDKDEEVWLNKPIPSGQSDRLTQRSDIINRLYKKNKRQGVTYQRTIVIHVDSDSKKERIDMYFYHKIESPTSQQFAATLHRTVGEKYDQYRKGRGYTGTVTSRDLHMLREVIPTGVFIELGNIRNKNDQARLILEKNRQLVADWLFEGVVKDQATR